MTFGELFDPDPPTWGLRGDPWLWHALRTHFSETGLPASADALERDLAHAFETLTGRPLATRDPFFVEAFSHGGLSSGGISPEFWRGTALALLRSRLPAALASHSASD